MRIVVAGASRGIGSALVEYFSGVKDRKIIAVSRNTGRLRELSERCSRGGSTVLPVTADLAQERSIQQVVESVRDFLGSVDVLIYNAGYLVNKPFGKLHTDDFDRLIDINLKGAFLLIQALSDFFSRSSHVLTISSMGGYQGSAKFPGLSMYSASKGALAVLTECLAEEFRERQIKCNCLALGAVQTEMLNEAFPGYEAPLKPDEMAKFIGDFALTGHHFFNGKILPVSLSTP
jgi:NAD(P)-dependent dehydrogenase (short-subunit alcohol dehydrogenase family)